MIHIGLFEGIGGFSLAAKWAGWTSPLACEIDTFCQAALDSTFPDAIIHGDIHTLTYESINIQLSGKYGADWRNDGIIVTGGFPCQPFSHAGKRNGKSDDRYLWPEMLRVIREVRPTWVVGENVAGLLSMDDGNVHEEVCASLEAEGYEVQPFIIPAIAVGAPHRRDRIWIVAHSDISSNRADGRSGGKEFGVSQFNRTEQLRAGELIGPVGLAKNSERDGWKYNGNQKAPEVREFGNTGAGNGIGVYRESVATDRRRRVEEGRRGGCVRGRECGTQEIFSANGGEFWGEQWPQVAARFCGVDDGLPDWMDESERKTIYNAVGYFGKEEVERRTGLDMQKVEWRVQRTKRLKALGNAIVPQVAYEIFRAINEVNEQLCATQSPQ